jgi:hypothetical protein
MSDFETKVLAALGRLEDRLSRLELRVGDVERAVLIAKLELRGEIAKGFEETNKVWASDTARIEARFQKLESAAE